MNANTTLYLADDHQIVVDGLKLLISAEDSIRIVGSSNDGETAYKQILSKKPDIVLIDLRMPGMSGLDLIYKLGRILPDTKFIILSMHGNPRDIRDAMNGGAAGYLLKNSGRDALIDCLRRVISGEKSFPDMKSKNQADKSLFTPRELEILKLVVEEEYSTPEIADHLSLSPLTVETHRKNICRKTNTSNNIGLIKFLRDNQIEL